MQGERPWKRFRRQCARDFSPSPEPMPEPELPDSTGGTVDEQGRRRDAADNDQHPTWWHFDAEWHRDEDLDAHWPISEAPKQQAEESRGESSSSRQSDAEGQRNQQILPFPFYSSKEPPEVDASPGWWHFDAEWQLDAECHRDAEWHSDKHHEHLDEYRPNEHLDENHPNEPWWYSDGGWHGDDLEEKWSVSAEYHWEKPAEAEDHDNQPHLPGRDEEDYMAELPSKEKADELHNDDDDADMGIGMASGGSDKGRPARWQECKRAGQSANQWRKRSTSCLTTFRNFDLCIVFVNKQLNMSFGIAQHVQCRLELEFILA